MGDEENVGTPPGAAGSANEGTHEGEKPPRPKHRKRTREADTVGPGADTETGHESEGDLAATEPSGETNAAPPEEKVEARPKPEVQSKPEAPTEAGDGGATRASRPPRFPRRVEKRRKQSTGRADTLSTRN
jgi:hypothetical protein